ncbi:hypothetical protein ACFFSY_19780 [Paenibacillus aurantiacus]|uniref:UDP-glucuronosyltransferase n=1 Tax=Paenibacillus aurantiacus TaxID=1936118 RepID=A0ABV5KSH8_9BACL
MANTITLLCSGVALGVYIPAVKLNYQLRQRGLNTEIDVLERYIEAEKQSKIGSTKREFHNSFKFALKGQKLALATDFRSSLDEDAVRALLARWHADERRAFMVFSGFWLPIVEQYKAEYGLADARVDIIHIDSDYSPSFQNYLDLCQRNNNIWLMHAASGRLLSRIHVTDDEPVPFAKRRRACLIHGGGWGMGTYQSKIPELRDAGIMLDIMAYYPEEAENGREGERFFLVDPDWSPWLTDERGDYTFPPFAEIEPGRQPRFLNNPSYPLLFDVTRQDIAVISKPGGSTLVDSLAAATPIVFLEPFGPHEQKNADLWIRHGFGIAYDDWRRSGFSTAIFEELHANLTRERNKLHDLGRNYHAAENRSTV